MQVHEIMSRDLRVCGPKDDLSTAARAMWDHDIGCLPVVEGRYLVGMITDRDICMAAYLQGCRLETCRVEDVMSREVRACGPRDDLEVALQRMAESQVRRLPVVEDLNIVGMVSLSDLAMAAASQPQARVGPEHVGTALAAVARPRSIAEVARRLAAA